MLTERALESFKQFVETNIAYAMVEYGGTIKNHMVDIISSILFHNCLPPKMLIM